MLHIQRPDEAKLLDAIRDAARGADGGGALFAFATESGVSALLAAPEIAELLGGHGTFEFYVGVDGITSPRALLRIAEATVAARGRLKSGAIVHDLGSTFHPKLVWFNIPSGLRIVLGSGNLTQSGLGGLPGQVGNWEAFTVAELRGAEAIAASEEIARLLAVERSLGHIVAPDDARAMAAAMENARRASSRARKRLPAAPSGSASGGVAEAVEVLVRELPRTRAGQADIGRPGLGFLGFRNSPVTAVLQYVGASGGVGAPQTRQLSRSGSKNYRVEIPEIREVQYGAGARGERPVLVASRIGDGAFRYAIVRPSDAAYNGIESLLTPLASAQPRRPMRYRVVSAAELREVWPDAPAALLPSDEAPSDLSL